MAKQVLVLMAQNPEGFEALLSAINEYGDQTYGQLLACSDDQLAGFRGMLLAITQLRTGLSRKVLTDIVDKSKRTDS